MLRFSLFGIPVQVDGWFWIGCVLLGGGIRAHGAEEWTHVAIWTVVVFVSVIFHELGHAVIGQLYGATPAIRLLMLGGLTYLPGANFTRKQSILVSAAGPAAGILLGCATLTLAFFLRYFVKWPGPIWGEAIRASLYVNFIWSLLNLLPIQPLDGGQILREVLGPRNLRVTCMIGMVLGGILAVWAAMSGNLFMALMMATMAYANFQNTAGAGGVIKD